MLFRPCVRVIDAEGMSALRGMALGAMGLTLLEVLVTSQKATQNFGGVFALIAKGYNRLVDPSVPLIPDLRSPSSSTSGIGGLFDTEPNIINQMPGGSLWGPAVDPFGYLLKGLNGLGGTKVIPGTPVDPNAGGAT